MEDYTPPPTQKKAVMEMLKKAGERGVTNIEFYASYLPRFSARIHELRQELRGTGSRIVSERIKNNLYRYKLITGDTP